MLGEADGTSTARIRRLQTMFGDAGFRTKVSANIGGWMIGHSAFVVPIGFALYRFDTNAAALAADARTLRLMVWATRDAFEALDDVEIPANLRWLYLRMPTAFAVRYWRRVFASPRGELWFGAHSRAAPDEMHALASKLRVGGPADRSAHASLRCFGGDSMTRGSWLAQHLANWRSRCALVPQEIVIPPSRPRFSEWCLRGSHRQPVDLDLFAWGRRDSNPHWRRFKRPASADWATPPELARRS